MRLNPFVTLTACTFALAACGGGGGGSDPTVSVPTGARAGTASAGSDLSAANAAGFVGPLARIMISTADGNVPGVSGDRESPQAAGGRSAALRGTFGLAATSAARALRGSGLEQALAVTTETLACPFGGSITVTVNDADNDNELSSGDSASVGFNACIAEQGLPAANGSLSFTVNAVELDANDEPTALDASLTLNGFVESGFGSMSGSFRVWFKQEGSGLRQRVSYLATTVLESGQTLRYDFDTYGVLGASSGTFDVVGAVTIGGQTYTVTSDVFSHTLGLLPASGTVRLRDAAGDAVILRARSSTTFDLEFQANGAATATVLATGLGWNNYRLGGN
jgi:hypothetical protein